MRPPATRAWLLLVLVLVPSSSPPGAAGPTGLTRAEREFLEHHWRRPVPPQGPAPARFSSIETSLVPAGCGVCHPVQFADWQTTIHSRSMGPGVAGQLADMAAGAPASVLDCLTCHAPLAEQSSVLRGPTDVVRNPAFDPGLERQGLVCAACHVRRWERFGPPRPDGTLESAGPRVSLPHHGATRTTAFVRSEFCMSCHQFGADGYALNGKLLENTYEEWKASPGLRVAIAVTVFPDHFYTEFFESLMAGGAGAAQIREALEATRRSAYTVFARTVPLT